MLRVISEHLWVAERDFSMGAIEFGGRMTVVRLEDGSLLLHSPIAIDDALAAELAELGPVRHLVSPNAFHHLFLEGAAERYRDATVYGTRALADKRPELKLDVLLASGSVPDAWQGSLDMLVMDGVPKIEEVVFYHRASQTLLLCDLVFNLHDTQGWFSRLFFRMLGVWKKVKQSPLWRFALTQDRAAAEASLQPMWDWDFERVILAHGRLIEGADAKEQLAEGLRWMCQRHAPRQLPAAA